MDRPRVVLLGLLFLGDHLRQQDGGMLGVVSSLMPSAQ